MINICLDPGHGPNYNTGAVKPYNEGTYMFNFAHMLKEELEKYNEFKVFVTRNNINDNPSLEERGNIAIRNNCKVFMSLHSNGFSSESAKGIVIFRSFKDKSTNLASLLLNDLVKLFKENGSIETYSRGVQVRKLDNGIADYYQVIRSSMKASTPVEYSMLLEHGFHSNIKECTFLVNEENLRKMAIREAKVLANYFDATLKISGYDSLERTIDSLITKIDLVLKKL